MSRKLTINRETQKKEAESAAKNKAKRNNAAKQQMKLRSVLFFGSRVRAMKNIRHDALEIVKKSIDAVLPEAAVKEALNNRGLLDEARKRGGKIVIISIGKAAWRMAKAAADMLPGTTGAIVTKYGHSIGDIPGIEIFEAGHPVPDENTIKGTEALLKHVTGLTQNDTVLFLVSGGGSALFELPADGVSLDDMADVTKQLLACGADIVEINTIRKHLSSVKGGRFAKLCAYSTSYPCIPTRALATPNH